MQTKKKVYGRNASREPTSRVSRSSKKVSENTQVAEKKVTELITSSARKKKSGMLLTSLYLCSMKFFSAHICFLR